ncbi:MAG TPA: VWA domain-containing protein [bacterium]|nr:VWA domain-containing protein [bacterium]
MLRSAAVSTLLLSLAFSSTVFAKTDIEFVFDASGSMRAAMGGSTQIDIAKQTIKSTIATIPADTNVALRVYAHRVEQTDKAGSCVDTELMIPFGPLNAAAFSAKVDSIQPKGYTPIAYSLSQVAGDFGVEREAEKVIILVSDGEETCGGDPVQAVKDLVAKGYKVKVNAVGFNVDAKTQAQLQAIAQAGGGQYYDARDGASLGTSLQKITQEALLVQKTTATYGTEIKGGDSYETAVPLTPGTEYKLNHHQRQNQFDYFYVDLKAGQQMTATLSTLGKGVNVQGEVATENTNPYAGFQIHDSNRQKLRQEEIIGGANATKTMTADTSKDQRIYLLIGSTYDNMNKDCPFKVEIKSFFDAGTQLDAGDTFETAMAVEKGKPISGAVMFSDEGDVYKITTAKGEPVTFTVLPENQKAGLKAMVFDDLRVELAQGHSPNEGAGFRVSAIATGPTTYIRVQRPYSDSTPSTYKLTFEGAAAGAPLEGGVPPPTASAPAAPGGVAPPPQSPAPTPTPTAPQVTEKVVEKPVNFSWTSAAGLKGLGISFGVGAFLGLVGGFMLGRPKKKPQTPAS